MKIYFSREDASVAKQVKESLLAGETVEWHNEFETFYGCSWFGWIKKQLTDIPCDIKVLEYDRFEGFVSSVRITPKSK